MDNINSTDKYISYILSFHTLNIVEISNRNFFYLPSNSIKNELICIIKLLISNSYYKVRI